MTSLKERQIEKMLDKIIGNGDDALRIVTKLALTNTEITPEVLATIQYLKKQNEEDAKALDEELNMTLDASGNIVPVSREMAKHDCLTYVSPTTPSALTFTIENGVINGVIDIGGNLVQDALPPVGKT